MLSQRAFVAVTDLFHQVSGIRLGEAKRPLVSGRLQKLAQQRGCASLDAYVAELLNESDAAELMRVVDKLTTNETFFFRESEHFDSLAGFVARRPAGAGMLRVWSAASSSGEEAYSIAMLLGDRLGLAGWQVLGTDLSTAMVHNARRGLYPLERARQMPPSYLKRWCLQGHDEHDGYLLVARELREHVRFEGGNLMQPLPPEIGHFEVIFLRNVLIYFDNAAKTEIIRRVLGRLEPGGLLFTGHAESIANLDVAVRRVATAVYAHADDDAHAGAHAHAHAGTRRVISRHEIR